MKEEKRTPGGPLNLVSGLQPRQAIPLARVEEIAREIRDLINAGEEHIAWERLNRLHPADIGSIVAGLPRASRDRLLGVMSPETVVWLFHHINPLVAARFGARLGTDALSFVLRQVQPRHALTALRRLPILRAREVAESLAEPVQEDELLEQEPNTAGELMDEWFPRVSVDERVEDARNSLREMDESRRQLSQLFVLGSSGELAGEVNMVEFALADGETPLNELVSPVIAVANPDTPIEECARLRRHYGLRQLPVVDEGKLVGVILTEALLGAVVEEDTRQMLQVASVAGESADGPISESIRTRLPWLTVNLGTTFLAAATVALFESTLAQVVVLAAFLPVVAGQGGIGGTQTLTLIVRAIALGELVGVSAARLLVRETVVGLIHGVFLGVLVAVIAMLWKQNPGLGLVLGLAMLGNMLIAGVVGAGVPLLLRRIGVDPAVASAVVVTTVTDVFGFLLFLGIATAAITLIV